MENNKKGIWIPQELIDDLELDWTNKILLAEIKSLHQLPKGCYISNNKLAIFLGISRTSIIRRLNNLVEMEYITTKNIYKNNKCVGRIITPIDKSVVAKDKGLVAKRKKVGRNCDTISRNDDQLVVATATGVVAKVDPIKSLTNSSIKSSTKSVINSDTKSEIINCFGVELEINKLKSYI
jgi:DNA-binding Lrp family transcriptional regulator